MIDEKDKEWRELTFSQREGEVPLPEPLQAGKLTQKFKNEVWLFIDTSIKNCAKYDYSLGDYFENSDAGRYWRDVYFSYHFDILEKPHDEIGRFEPKQVKEWIKNVILQGEYHEILTVLEYILRYEDVPKNLYENIEGCFESAPYFIERSSIPVCIVPTTSSEMKENVKRSLGNINESKLTGAKQHLRNSSQELNNNNFPDSIRESIHAVEAAARQIAPNDSRSLSAALDSLEKNGKLKHPALKEAFKKLYGYTSAEKGVRHSLIEKEAADVGFDEAIFMYGACVSFVDYLASKYRQKEEK